MAEILAKASSVFCNKDSIFILYSEILQIFYTIVEKIDFWFESQPRTPFIQIKSDVANCFNRRVGLTLCNFFLFTIILRQVHLRHANSKKKQASLQCPDIISQLPDEILISIISRIPVKDAIRTCVLSHRWRNLYRFVSTIRLDCDCLLGDHHYFSHMEHDKPHVSKLINNSLDRFLRLSSGSNIRCFRLLCCLSADRLEQLIYTLGRSGVVQLGLLCTCCKIDSYHLSFSCHLLSEMPSLTHCRLSFCCLRPSPTINQCNSLQSLNLSSVTLLSGAIECILSNCLMLLNMNIYNCKCPSKISLCGARINLKYLYIIYCKGIEVIEVYASNLFVFEFHNLHVATVIFDHAPRLQSLYLKIQNTNLLPHVYRELAKDLPNLEMLNFCTRGDNLPWGRHSKGSTHTGINVFSKLRRLNINVFRMSMKDLLLLTPTLQSCPLLREFSIDTKEQPEDDDDSRAQGGKKETEVVLHSELKEVKMRGFVGSENEIEFALYILKSAICLEKMEISRFEMDYTIYSKWRRYRQTPWSDETKSTMCRRLRGQAVSKTARVILQHG